MPHCIVRAVATSPIPHRSDPLRDALATAIGAGVSLGRELGGGGMSRVFVARDTTLDRDIVVKVLAPELAALGIYAVLSCAVSQRVREIGIRMALRESTASVRHRVVGRTLVLAGVGVIIGAAVSVGALLYGVGPTDVVSFGATALVLLLASAIAGFILALCASRTDPMVALRSS